MSVLVSIKNFIFIIGFILFIGILSTVNIDQVIALFTLIDLEIYFFAIILIIGLVILKGVKWKFVLLSQKVNISVFEATKYFCIGFFFSAFTPARSGDLVRAAYIKEKTNLSLAVSSVVLDRVIDVLILLIYGSCAAMLFFSTHNSIIFPIEFLLVLILIVSFVFFLLFNEKYVKFFLRPIFNLVVPEKIKKKVATAINNFFSSVKLVLSNKKLFIISIVIGFAYWFFSIYFFYLLSEALKIGLSLEIIFLIYPLVSLADSLPISVSGFGTRDAVLIFFFSFLAFSSEQAVALSLLFFISTYVLISIIGYIFFLLNPIDVKGLLN